MKRRRYYASNAGSSICRKKRGRSVKHCPFCIGNSILDGFAFFSYLRLFAAVPWALLVGSGILHCAGAFEKPWTTAAGEPEVFELVPWRARWRVKMEQRRQYKIFRCPSCGIKLRVPRGKGKIKVTCRQCGATFEKKSWREALCICKKMKKVLDKPGRRWYIIKAVTEKQKKRWRKKKNIFLTKAKSCAKVQ